jgi:hypothetical protein
MGVSRVGNDIMITAATDAPLERHFPAKKMAARGGHPWNAGGYFGARFM